MVTFHGFTETAPAIITVEEIVPATNTTYPALLTVKDSFLRAFVVIE